MSGVAAGHLLAGRYRLLDLLAEGAMGEVWRGRDDRLERDVAVKVLRPELADDEAFLVRFRGEARHAAAVRHPHVAAVHDYGEDPALVAGGPTTAFLVMDLLQGRPLDELLAAGGPLAPARVAHLLAQVADALGAAHAIDLVHRDIKPANLLVGPDDDLTVTDFGIARAADAVALTGTGLVMGTVEYLSPEQARGGRASPASDVYSLGAVGFELLTGSPPFSAATPAGTAAAHVQHPVPALPDTLPRPLADTVLACLAKDPAARPTVGELAVRLRADVTRPAPPVHPVAAPDGTDPRPDLQPVARPTTILPTHPAVPPVVAAPPAPAPRVGRRPARTRAPLVALLLIALLLLVGYLLDGRASAAAPGHVPHLTTASAFHVERWADGSTAKDSR